MSKKTAVLKLEVLLAMAAKKKPVEEAMESAIRIVEIEDQAVNTQMEKVDTGKQKD